jgi:hypothetical protein
VDRRENLAESLGEESVDCPDICISCLHTDTLVNQSFFNALHRGLFSLLRKRRGNKEGEWGREERGRRWMSI